jgi:hypothetical protein
MMIVSWLATIACIVCWIMVLLKMFPAEGPIKGILAIICGLYAFIWGWMNASRFNLKNIMLIWTVAILASIVASFMGASIYPMR